MKKTGKAEGNEYGFERLPDGTYNLEIQEGVEFAVTKNKDTDEPIKDENGNIKESMRIPHKVIDGEHDGGDYMRFININDFGEQQIADVLAVTKLTDGFNKKFPGEVEMFDDKVRDMYKVKLPYKTYQVDLETRKANNGKEYQNVIAIRPYSKINEEGTKATSKAVADNSDDEDWIRTNEVSQE